MSHRTVSRYVASELLAATGLAFLFFFFIFFVNQLLLLAERILAKRVPFADVAMLVVYSLPIIVTYALPFGTLVGAMMAVGRLVADGEITALRASGVSPTRVFAPMLAVGLALSGVAFAFNDLALPLGNIGLKSMLRKLVFQNPAIELDSYAVKRYEGTVIVTGEVSGRRIRPLMIIDQDKENRKRVITAKEAVLVPARGDQGAVALELRDVTVHTSRADQAGDYDYGSARRMVYNILLKDISVSLVNPGPAEKSSVDVAREIAAMRQREAAREVQAQERQRVLQYRLALAAIEAMRSDSGLSAAGREEVARLLGELQREAAALPQDRELLAALLEFHRKFASPFSCAVFVAFAFPTALAVGAGGRTLGFALGVVVSGLYWGLLVVSYRLGARGSLPPAAAMWLPNLVVLCAAGVTAAARRRP